MRVLWSLPRAAPVLLRHLGAYVDLAGQDLARAQVEISARIVASALVLVTLFFAVTMACLAVVASTWDTPYRVAAIMCLGGGFFLLAIAAALYRARVLRTHSPWLSSVRREWRDDRVILERLLSSDED
jgi:uncharacterized membrane protein YqjE